LKPNGLLGAMDFSHVLYLGCGRGNGRLFLAILQNHSIANQKDISRAASTIIHISCPIRITKSYESNVRASKLQFQGKSAFLILHNILYFNSLG